MTYLPLECLEFLIYGLDYVLKTEDTSLTTLFSHPLEVNLGENVTLHLSTGKSSKGIFYRSAILEKQGPSRVYPFWLKFESLPSLLSCLKSLVVPK